MKNDFFYQSKELKFGSYAPEEFYMFFDLSQQDNPLHA